MVVFVTPTLESSSRTYIFYHSLDLAFTTIMDRFGTKLISKLIVAIHERHYDIYDSFQEKDRNNLRNIKCI